VILEVAILHIRTGRSLEFERAFAEAQIIIASMPGYISHKLQRCVEAEDKYILLARWRSVRDHERRSTKTGAAIPGNRPTTAIVRVGPYRFSRNPIYLAFTLFQIGLSFWVNSLALLATLIPVVALMSLIVIPREERYLEARFPSEYLPYKASVRRWL
jgi:antibiotic biosynthesis monooxygenase (ABM) superfamily enzyme